MFKNDNSDFLGDSTIKQQNYKNFIIYLTFSMKLASQIFDDNKSKSLHSIFDIFGVVIKSIYDIYKTCCLFGHPLCSN